MSEEEAVQESELSRWLVPLVLLAATFVSMLYVGSGMEAGLRHAPTTLLDGWKFAVPLMAILFAHEMGHYIAGKIHGVDISPPYFIPAPIFLLGTLGAVIRMRGTAKSRNALLDVGAAGPLAGMVVALPVLVYGLYTSEVLPFPAEMPEGSFVEGRGLLYVGLLYLLKGPIPPTHDIWLNATAMAGWAGLLVTMINLIPVAQLDGGHVAYALFGPKQDRYSRIVHRLLPVVGVVVSIVYLVPAVLAGERGADLAGEALAGASWVSWAILLAILVRLSGSEHPPTGPEPLSPGRKAIAWATLGLFVLLFMPAWIYDPNPF